ncbi:DcaP family trimeric outer membrane transporter [Halioxenophilus sp. WMMB6]|uniref:DcaP family trimeric outer membrane transporter n=1 Tax=Halioxenophilus sp. WMMB6 TaxID=3073815 RepID=UPI00295EE9FF|nr:DcaP family trimeric outer membrane transporter [Halioxenophilus sp. WMMB6]
MSRVFNEHASVSRLFSKSLPYKKVLPALIIAAGATCSGLAAADDVSKKIADLEAEINALKTKVESKSGPEVKPGTHFQYGGFIKTDFIFSEYSDGDRASASVGDDFLVPSVIPVGDGNYDSDPVFDANAKFSRFWLKTTTKAGDGSVTSYIEMDFNASNDERLTNQSSNGLRHAFLQYNYGEGDSILAGQTWSTFFNTAALPEAIDFVGPTSGSLFIRQTQVRFTKGLGAGKSLMFSLENPSTSLYDGGAGFSSNQYDNNSLPDVVARYNGSAGDFSYSFAGMLREIAYKDTGSGSESDELAGAANFSGVYKFGNGDNIKMSLSYGTLGRYIALNAFRDGVIEADGGIDLVDTLGGFVAYQHSWSEQWRSTFSYATSTADNPSSAGGAVTKTVSNANANILYSPVPKLTFGAEVIFAERELENGTDGDLQRLQFMAKWVF